MTKIQERINKDERVLNSDQDSDGCWIYLKTGWYVNGDEAIIVEDTWTKAADKLRSAKAAA